MSERILVCGGRNFGSPSTAPFYKPYTNYKSKEEAELEKQLCFRVLNAAKTKYNIECIIQGGARGADKLGKIWALDNSIPMKEYKADWNGLGKRAGIVRNQEMLDEAKPTLVIAFRGGNGTRDMIARAKKAGVKVIEVP